MAGSLLHKKCESLALNSLLSTICAILPSKNLMKCGEANLHSRPGEDRASSNDVFFCGLCQSENMQNWIQKVNYLKYKKIKAENPNLTFVTLNPHLTKMSWQGCLSTIDSERQCMIFPLQLVCSFNMKGAHM